MKNYLESKIEGNINANHVQIGKGVIVEKGVEITGKGGPADKVILGDYCFIGQNSKIITPEFRLGDYSKLNMYSFGHGKYPLHIGRNCWIGGNTILDSQGGLVIDDNVGIGAHSQVWTHIQFGDIVEGCRFYSNKFMHIEKDVWFVGKCIVSPVRVGEKSMAMAGSVVTHDMEPNHIYGGVPAKDISDKMGMQFDDRSISQKENSLLELFDTFFTKSPEFKDKLEITRDTPNYHDDITYFNLVDRTYTKKYSLAEVVFLKEHVPLVKFFPHGEPEFVDLDVFRKSTE